MFWLGLVLGFALGAACTVVIVAWAVGRSISRS